jgi:hypothetical protein
MGLMRPAEPVAGEMGGIAELESLCPIVWAGAFLFFAPVFF